MKSPARARGSLLAVVGCLLVSMYALLAPAPANAQSSPPASAAPTQANAAPTLTLFGVNSLDPNNVLVVNRYTGLSDLAA